MVGWLVGWLVGWVGDWLDGLVGELLDWGVVGLVSGWVRVVG